MKKLNWLWFGLLLTNPALAYLTPIGGGGGGGVSSVSGTAPIQSSGGSTPIISCIAATGSVAGCLSAGDWTIFNGKQAALGYTPVNKAGDNTVGPISFGTATTTAGAAYFDGGGVDDLASPIALKNGANANTRWDFYINPSSGVFSLYNPNQNFQPMSFNPLNETFGIGGTGPLWALNISYPDSSTSAGGNPVTNSPVLVLQNTDTTDGNMEHLAFNNSGNAIVCMLMGVNENHLAPGSQSGHAELHCRLAGVDTLVQSWNSDGTIKLPPRANGDTPTCGSPQSGNRAMTFDFIDCVCNGSAWVQPNSLHTACTF